MKKMLFAFMIIFMSVSIYSQNSSTTVFSNGDKILVVLTGESNYYYVHEVQKGQSLYSLSKAFKIPLETLYQINNIQEGATIALYQKIKIPINDNLLYKGVDLSGLTHGHFIPVYYKTKPKDNLFRISRIFFNQPTEDLVKRNNLTSHNLSLGQEILIGWFPIENAKPVVREEEFEEDFELPVSSLDKPNSIAIDENSQNALEIEPENEIGIDSNLNVSTPQDGFNLSLLGALVYSDKMKEIKRTEVANWDKTMPDNGTVYVLHKNAIIDSYIEIYNPNVKRSVRAKVIGRIPYGAYTNNVKLVLSPRAAKQLGGRDNRFKVEVKALVLTGE